MEERLPDDLIGRDLRALRKRRGLTLQTLAARVGRSVGYLSEAERGLTALSIEELSSLAAALEVPLTWFMVQDWGREEERGIVGRWGRRREIGSVDRGHAEELLSPKLGGAFEMIYSQFAPGAERRRFITRDTEECGYLTSGELELWIGDKHFLLHHGDAFRIEREPFRWRNPGTEVCTVVWVIAPPIY
jgi:transcriptional regulator with XRE-family HTH domain